MTRKILKRLVLCVTAVAIAMGISVPATATSGFCTPSESFDVDEAYTWIYSHLSYPNLNDADKQELIEDYQGRHYNVAAAEILKCVKGSYIIYA